MPSMQLRSSSRRQPEPLSEPEQQGSSSKRHQQEQWTKEEKGLPARERVLLGDPHLLMEVLQWLDPLIVVDKATDVCPHWAGVASR